MLKYTLRCSYRFLDQRAGIVVESFAIEAAHVDGAIHTARALTADKPGLAFNTAVLTLDATGGIAWRLQAPVAAFDDALPSGAGL